MSLAVGSAEGSFGVSCLLKRQEFLWQTIVVFPMLLLFKTLALLGSQSAL